MSTTKAKKEAKLKARKTSLSKKTNEELIDIILKKDNTERKNNDKIVINWVHLPCSRTARSPYINYLLIV